MTACEEGPLAWVEYTATNGSLIPCRSLQEVDHIRQQMEWQRVVKEAQKRIAFADKQDRKPREGRDL